MKKKNKKPHYVAVLKHDEGRKKISVPAHRGIAVAVHQILCAEACPKCAIVSVTKVFKSGARLKLKNW